MKEGCKKYIPFKPVELKSRTWPCNKIEHAPIWCSVDLRDGNQALIDPMNLPEKLEMFKTLCAIGIKEIEDAKITFYHGDGCPKCNGIGFKGRMGIFEIFIVNEELQQMIYEGRTLVELRTKARELGMRSMREDGIRKVGGGLTTADEVLKVTLNEA